MFLYYIFLGFSPALFCLWYFYKRDKWEPEPKFQVIKIFLIGLFSIIPAGILEWVIQHKLFAISIYQMKIAVSLNFVVCFMIIGPIEEFFKYSVVKVFMFHKEDFNEKVDGVIYMVAAAMGFSALENVMYILYSPDQATFIGIMRGVMATPAHAIFSGFLGVYLGKAKFAETKMQFIKLLLFGFLIAILLHGFYDFLIFAGKPWGIGVIPLLIISGYILSSKIKELVDTSQFKK